MKKMMMAMASLAAVLGLTMVAAPAQAAYSEKLVNCDGGSASIGGYFGAYTGSGEIDVIGRIYDNPSQWHHWDLWLYRNGNAVRTGHEYGDSIVNWYNVTNPSGPDEFKFRFANDSRSINCTAVMYL